MSEYGDADAFTREQLEGERTSTSSSPAAHGNRPKSLQSTHVESHRL